MISFLTFIISLLLFLFVPGYLLVGILWRAQMTLFERFALAVPLSFALTTAITLIMPYAGIALTRISLLVVCGVLIVTLLAAHFWIRRRSDSATPEPLIQSTRTWQIFGLLAAATILVQTTYYINTIFPTATDLGHHMYWAQWITEHGTIPIYEKTIVAPDDPSAPATSSASFVGVERIPDFIIGEHLVFAAIALVSSAPIVSAFPSLTLALVLIATTLCVFLLALRMLHSFPWGERAALWVYFLAGPIWTISGAGAKFVTGGVVGNLLGNLLIITSIYFLYRALVESHRGFLTTAAALIIVLIYTHHLSTFVLGYALVGMIAAVLIAAPARIRLPWSWCRLLSPTLLILLVSTGAFLLVHTPSYLNPEAISSSVGTPTKSTRTGLPLAQLAEMIGDARFLLACLGTLALAALLRRGRHTRAHLYALAMLIGWHMMIILMVITPETLRVNILSTRIATYSAIPTALLAGASVGWLLYSIRQTLPRWAFVSCAFVLMFFVTADGLRDNMRSLKASPETARAVATFHTADYVSEHLHADTWALKDHNYITADTWMKVFMPRDYTNPLSRSYFARYESQPHREHCTREMITVPDSAMSRACFEALSVGPVIVDTQEDALQFADNPDFIRVYQNDILSVFWYQPQS